MSGEKLIADVLNTDQRLRELSIELDPKGDWRLLSKKLLNDDETTAKKLDFIEYECNNSRTSCTIYIIKLWWTRSGSTVNKFAKALRDINFGILADVVEGWADPNRPTPIPVIKDNPLPPVVPSKDVNVRVPDLIREDWKTPNIRFDVFISYCANDSLIKQTAIQLYENLGSLCRGASIYLDEKSHAVISKSIFGITFAEADIQAMLSTRGGGIVVLLISPSYLGDERCLIQLALAYRFKEHLRLAVIFFDDAAEKLGNHSMKNNYFPRLNDISLKLPQLRPNPKEIATFLITQLGDHHAIGETASISFFKLMIELNNFSKGETNIIMARIQTDFNGIRKSGDFSSNSALFCNNEMNLNKLIAAVDELNAHINVGNLLLFLNSFRTKWFGFFGS